MIQDKGTIIKESIRTELIKNIDIITDISTYLDHQRGTMGVYVTNKYFLKHEQNLTAEQAFNLGKFSGGFQYWFRIFKDNVTNNEKFDYKKCAFLLNDFGVDELIIKFYSDYFKNVFDELNDNPTKLFEYHQQNKFCVKLDSECERIEAETKVEILKYLNND